MNCNKKVGNAFEQELCQILSDHGYWAHNMAQNVQGQPFDVICAQGGRADIIDCKVCEHDRFALSRMEENQISAMRKWQACGNGRGWFALKMSSGEIRFISAKTLIAEEQAGKKSLSEKEILKMGLTVEEWL